MKVDRRAFVQGLTALAILPRTHTGTTRLRFRVHHVLDPVDGAWSVAGRLVVVLMPL